MSNTNQQPTTNDQPLEDVNQESGSMNHQQHEHFQVVQKILFYNPSEKKFLLLKDARKHIEFYRKYGPWDLPGGRVDQGETLPIALEREIVEEVGPLQYELAGNVHTVDMHIEQDLDGDKVKRRLLTFYLAYWQSGEVVLSADHSEFRWATVKEIEDDNEVKPWLKDVVTKATAFIKNSEYLSDLKRVQADFENYKKRQQAESKEFSAHLAKSIVTDLIPVLSNLQAAADHVPADLRESPWVMGITYIEKQFEDALKNYGVTAIEVKPGDPFNPTEHEAVDQQSKEGEESEHKIEKVVQKGYKMGERVIKAARVIVS